MTDKRSIVNMSLGYNGYPFMNLLKEGEGFQFDCTRAPNANGSPSQAIITAESNNQTGVYIPRSWAGLTMVLKFTGQQKVFLNPGGGPGSGSISSMTAATGAVFSAGRITLSGGVGSTRRVEWTFAGKTDDAFWNCGFDPTGSFGTDAGEVIICRASDEAALSSGLILNPDYKSKMQAMNPRAVRSMQITHSWDASNIVSKPSTYAKPESHLTWRGQSFHSGMYVGAITGTTALTCGNSPDATGAVTPGEMLHGRMTSASVAITTLTRSGSGVAYPVVGPHADSIGALIGAGGDVNFTFDWIAQRYVATWGNADGANGGGVMAGPPLSALVKISNELNTGMYWCMPILITDTEVASCTQYIRDNLNSGLECFFELANETWGDSAGPNNLLRAWATALGVGSTSNAYVQTAYRVRQIFEIIKANWSPRTTAERKMTFAMNMEADGDPAQFTLQLEGSDFSSLPGGWNTYPNRPVDFSDCIAYAHYIGAYVDLPDYEGFWTDRATTPALWAAIDDYASGVPAQMASALTYCDTQLRSSAASGTDLASFVSRMLTWDNRAVSYDTGQSRGPRPAGMSPLEVIAYEGNPEFSRPTPSKVTSLGESAATYAGRTGRCNNLLTAYRASDLFKALVFDMATQFANTGTHHTSPSCYDFFGLSEMSGSDSTPNPSDMWSIGTGDLYDPPRKSYDGWVLYGATAEGGGTTPEPTPVTPPSGKGRKIQIHSQGPWAYRR